MPLAEETRAYKARWLCRRCKTKQPARSSNGLGRRSDKAETKVRLLLGLLTTEFETDTADQSIARLKVAEIFNPVVKETSHGD